jgi:type I restriction enzyme, S subunit
LKDTSSIISLGELIFEPSQKLKKVEKLSVWSVTKIQGFVNSSDFFSHQIHSINLEKYKVINPLDIAFNPSRINVGSVAINTSDDQGLVSPIYVVVKCNEKIRPFFLFYFLKSELGLNKIKNFLEGSVRQSLKFKNLSRIEIWLPSREEQDKIISNLINLDNLINSYEKILDSTKNLKHGLMQQILVNGINHKKFKKIKWLFGKIIEIPDTWNISCINKIAIPKGIKTGPFGSSLVERELNGTDVRVLYPEDINNGNISVNGKCISKEKFTELKEFEIDIDEVVISLMGSIGKVGIVSKDIGKAIISKHLLKIIINQKLCLPQFLVIILNSPLMQLQIDSRSQGLTMKGLNTKIIKNLICILPSLNEQEKIVSVFSVIDKKIIDLETKIKLLDHLKKGLVQKLLTGQIRV